MLIFHLRNSICLRQSKIISTLATKQYYSLNSKEADLKCHACKVPTSTLTQYRHFSFSGVYSFVSESTPVVNLQGALLDFHQSSGLPWWAVITLTTLSIRTLIVFPLAIHQHQVIARLANINVEMGKLVPELNKEVNAARVLYKWKGNKPKKVFKKQMRILFNNAVIRDNCHPFKTILLALIQIPVWVCFSFSLRNLTAMSMHSSPVSESLKSLKTEGMLWFPDLTCPEPFVIPIMLLFVNLALIELNALKTVGTGSLLQKVLLNSSRVVIGIVSAVATLNPSSVTFYWLCSSTYGLLQNIFLMSPKVKRALRIPATAKESLTPFKDIATNLKNKFNK